MANNNAIFNGALTGATAGIASRWITSTVAADYDAQRALIEDFATEVDSLIAPGSYDQGSADLMESICNSFWKDRILTDQTNIPLAAGAIVALFTSVNSAVIPGGSGSVGNEWGKTWFVSPDYADGDSNGSANNPFTTLQDAIDVASSGDTIVLAAGNAGDGDLGFLDGIAFVGLAGVVSTEAQIGAITGLGSGYHTFTNVAVQSINVQAGLYFVNARVTQGPIVSAEVQAFETIFDFDASVATDFDITLAGLSSKFINCTFTAHDGATLPTLFPAGTMPTYFDNASARSFQETGWAYGIPGDYAAAPADLETNLKYGDGSDGSLSGAFGTVSLTRDMYYEDVSGEGRIDCNGFRVYVSGVLDLRDTTSGTLILVNSNGGTTGIDAVGQTQGGSGGSTPTQGTLPTATAGVAGGKGGAVGGVGQSGTSTSATNNSIMGGEGAVGGTGGTAAAAGGAPGNYNASNNAVAEVRFPPTSFHLARPFQLTTVSARAGSGGGGGGGGATGVGGGGGGSSLGSSAGEINARVIIRNAGVSSVAIDGRGNRGGNGGNGDTDGAGGGGAGGTGGSAVAIYYDWLIGTADACITVSGGVGGNGGNGAGGAPGGTGGTGGNSGTVLTSNQITRESTFSTRVAGTAGSGPTGSNGGAGGPGGVLVVTL